MTLHDQLIASRQRGIFDDIPSPYGVLAPLIEHLPLEWILWETAPGSGELAKHLRETGYGVIENTQLFPSFVDPGQWDAIVTNPPYSQKWQFLKYSDAKKKPWALLLPITVLGVGKCQPYLVGSEILFFPKRIDFTGKGHPWFSVAWFTKGLNIGKQLNFP